MYNKVGNVEKFYWTRHDCAVNTLCLTHELEQLIKMNEKAVLARVPMNRSIELVCFRVFSKILLNARISLCVYPLAWSLLTMFSFSFQTFIVIMSTTTINSISVWVCDHSLDRERKPQHSRSERNVWWKERNLLQIPFRPVIQKWYNI